MAVLVVVVILFIMFWKQFSEETSTHLGEDWGCHISITLQPFSVVHIRDANPAGMTCLTLLYPPTLQPVNMRHKSGDKLLAGDCQKPSYYALLSTFYIVACEVEAQVFR